MTKEVSILINSLQKKEQAENAAVSFIGNYYLKNGVHYIFYDEVAEGGSIIKNSVKISGSRVEIAKKGELSYRLVFETLKNNVSYYITPYGNLEMDVSTESVEVHENEDSIDVKIKYALKIDKEHFTDCEVAIDISSVKS